MTDRFLQDSTIFIFIKSLSNLLPAATFSQWEYLNLYVQDFF